MSNRWALQSAVDPFVSKLTWSLSCIYIYISSIIFESFESILQSTPYTFMPNDPSHSRTNRLVLSANAPPPPIPPRLISRMQDLQRRAAAAMASASSSSSPKWIDRDEFAMASRAHQWHPTAAASALNPPGLAAAYASHSQMLPYGPNTMPPLPLPFTHASVSQGSYDARHASLAPASESITNPHL